MENMRSGSYLVFCLPELSFLTLYPQVVVRRSFEVAARVDEAGSVSSTVFALSLAR
jgi:hypothetical protein